MMKLYKIHRTSEEYHKYKNDERNKTVKKLIGNAILRKIQGKQKKSILGFESRIIGTESFTGSKIWLERKETIERRASITTSVGDQEEDVKFWDLQVQVHLD